MGERMTGRARRGLVLAACLLGAAFVAIPAYATSEKPLDWRHAISLTGAPKYPADFRHPDYVNVNAPKAGRLRVGAVGSFDNFNPVISGVKGNLAAWLMHVYEPLLQPTLDEQTTEYGLLAEAVATPEDQSAAAFRLRPEARWHDGRPVTADDVIFSYEVWKRLSPQFNRMYQKVVRAERLSDREVRFVFSEGGDPSLPLYLGQMSILPKHWWEGRDANGRRRDIGQTTLEIPLGSGPYRLVSFVPGRSLVYERAANYWGTKLPIRVGADNFARIEVEYFRDAAVMFEAWKADQLDVRREISLKSWVVGYDEDAVKEGRQIKDAFPVERLGVLRAFVFNQRRARFTDVRLRKALALAYGFDDVNRRLFYSMLQAPVSFFPQTDFEAAGSLTSDERKLAMEFGDALPATVHADIAPHLKDRTARSTLFKALKLLQSAGYRLEDGKLLDSKGEQLTVELLLEDAAMERVAAAYAENLAKLGIAAPLRLVDGVQYQNRLRSFDFDMVVHGWVQGHAPGNEVREYFASDSRDRRGTNNLAGVASPVVDALIEKLVKAPARAEKVAAGRLLDRLLRAEQVGVPISYENREYIAAWNRFGRPEKLPRYGASAFPTLWWWDEDKAKKLSQR
ncbi:MAG: extracellular solute-binding protein [Beijerinckiaceae bacterium]